MTPTTPSDSLRSGSPLFSRSAPPAGPLAPGTTAPAFALRCGPYRDTTLGDYRGTPLVLAFYVADWHPVCTAQLERYRDLLPELERLGAGLAAISADTVWSHGAFARAHGLPFPLLADDRPRAAMARAYGVYDAQREGAQRALFVVDPAGTVAWSAVFPEAVDPGVDGILTTLERLAGRVATPDAPPSVAPDAGGGQGTVETAPRPSRPRPVRTGRSRTATQDPPTGRGAGPPAGAA